MKKTDQIARVVLLLHGAGGSPGSFIPLAKKMSEAGIENVYTVTLKQTDEDPVPVSSLQGRIEEITQKYLNAGYVGADFCLVGHSLGALVASKNIWREQSDVFEAITSRMISVAGRIKYVENKFSWFCEGVKPDIDLTYEAIQQNPQKAKQYTIWGSEDGLVPKESVHYQNNEELQCTVNGWGHSGILFAPETQNKIVEWVQAWA